MIKIAIQKKGRMSQGSTDLLKKAGLRFFDAQRSLIAPCSNFPAEILYLRDDDIPQYVQDGIADIGIVGENVLYEHGQDVEVIKKLGFSKCRLSLAVPREIEYEGVEYFRNKEIATTYTHILEDFFAKKNIPISIHHLTGSVEIAPGIGLADGIFDIVSTGSTLLANGLKEVEVVMKSEAVLIANKDLSADKKEDLQSLLFRIEAIQQAEEYKYILLNAPEDEVSAIIDMLPGMKSPTVLPLHESGWCSVHTVIKEEQFWDIVQDLKAHGAEGILITSIDKMIL